MQQTRRLAWRHPTLTLNPVALYAHETLSGGCLIWVTIWCQHELSSLTTLIGYQHSISLKLKKGMKYFTGMCHTVKARMKNTSYNIYDVKLIGIPNLLAQHIDYRIYHNKTAVDCFQLIAKRHRLLINTAQATPSKPQAYIQYNESHAHFLTRLCYENAYLFWHQHNEKHASLVIMNKDEVEDRPIKSSTIDDLCRSQHQLWHLTKHDCYGNDPSIMLGDRITKQHIVVGIQHDIVDDGTAHHYQQHYHLSDRLILPKVDTPKATGIEITAWSQVRHMSHHWDQADTQRTLPKKNALSTKLRCHVRFKANQPLLTYYQARDLKRPFISGHIFKRSSLSPYHSGKQSFAQGILSAYENQLSYTNAHNLEISSLNHIQLTASKRIAFNLHTFDITSDNSLSARSKKIIISSDTTIKLQTAHAYIHITPDHISIKADSIHFNDPGIVNTPSN